MSDQEEGLLKLMQEVYTQGTEQDMRLSDLLHVISEKLTSFVNVK